MKKRRRGIGAALVGGLACLLVSCAEEGQEAAPGLHDRGRSLYLRNGCAVCHGDEGRGDGRLAATLRPPPRDFRDAQAYKQGRDVESIAQTISSGLAGTNMPAFAHLSAADRVSIARFIVDLQTQSQQRESIE